MKSGCHFVLPRPPRQHSADQPGQAALQENELSRKKVVFLHGLGADTRVFKRLIEILPAKIEGYLVDLLGHGESEAPNIEYTVENQAKAVGEFIKEMEIEQSCYLFGNSYGGWVAATMAQGKYDGLGVILEDAVGLKEYFEDISKSISPLTSTGRRC